MPQAILFLSYISILSLPGMAISQLLRLQGKLLYSLGFSYCFFILSLFIFQFFNFGANNLLLFLFIACFISIFYIAKTKSFSIPSNELKSAFCILIALAFYQLFFGTFNEVPADLYQHLHYYQLVYALIEQNSLGEFPSAVEFFLRKGNTFYFLPAILSYGTKTTTSSLLPIAIFTHVAFFLIATMSFALQVFKNSKHSILAALLTTLFVFLHFGINIFSYVRYYAFAPTILSYVLYYCALSLAFKSVKHGALTACCILACIATHRQEAIFIAVILTLMIGIQLLSQKRDLCASQKFSFSFIGIALSGFTALYFYGALELDRAVNLHNRLWEFTSAWKLFPAITILNLSNQFIQVVTLWGVLIYALFLIHIKRYKNNLFILAGMLSPLFTVLNPFFVDIFLRLYNSTTLWRLCYVIPLHFVAADLILLYAHKLKTTHQTTIKIITATTICGLFLLLLPIKNTWQGIHFSRFTTLDKTQYKTSYHYYQDLIDFLDTLPKKEIILTDPMTGYMISGLTRHYNIRRKFTNQGGFKRIAFLNYSDFPLQKHSEQILIINQREKPISHTGKLAKHWFAHTWKNTKHHYPTQLIQHIKQNENAFQLIWSNHDIQVYRIIKL